ncbi:MAG: hypothetical protein NVSMB26_25170 [Beijerinckiaceae bacterium]
MELASPAEAKQQSASQQLESTEPQLTGNPTLPAPDALLQPTESELTSNLTSQYAGDPDAQLKWAVRISAMALQQLDFERIHRSIFGSQIALLKRLNIYGQASVQECENVFKDAVSRFPQFYANYTFKQWGVRRQSI